MERLAESSDLEGLLELWNLGFPGEEAFGRYIFDRFPDPQNFMVYEEAGRLDAMLIMLPRNLLWGGERFGTGYIMGVTTRPTARGRGIMTRLMGSAHRVLTARGLDLAALIPAEKSLFDYYAKLGYSPFFPIERKTLRPTRLPEDYTLDMHSINTACFDGLYRAAMTGSAYIERGSADWLCAMDEHRKFGGSALLIYHGGRPVSYAFFYDINGKIRISEALGLDLAYIDAACSAVFGQTGAGSAELISPAKQGGEPFGSALALSDKGRLLLQTARDSHPYINLIHN